MNFDLTGENLTIYVECPRCKNTYGVTSNLKSDVIFEGMKNDFRDIADREYELTCPECNIPIRFNLNKELLNTKNPSQPKKKGLFGKMFGKK